ncbi:MAG: DUF3006 domain-containing protein [Alphaproteobacteria bacterium]|nr:DUF3006 domain-containing protein [Alphaproteobacteria bacterium]
MAVLERDGVTVERPVSELPDGAGEGDRVRLGPQPILVARAEALREAAEQRLARLRATHGHDDDIEL